MPDADAAEVIVLFGSDGATRGRGARPPRSSRSTTMDATRRFARVRADGGEPLGGDASRRATGSRTALSAELVGVAQRAMEMAVEYARDRKQFGRPIGAYQAVSHRCAQMLLEIEGARSAAYYAAWSADAEPESLPAGGVDGEGLRLGRRLARVRLVAPGARRHRLHLGARPALLPEAGEGGRAALRLARASTASAWPRRPGGSRKPRSATVAA